MAKKTATRKMNERHNHQPDAPEANSVEEKVGHFLHSFVLPHWPMLVAAVLVIIIAAIAGKQWSDYKAEKLATAFAEVRTAETVSQLRQLASEYKDTKPGELAAFSAARQLYEEEQYLQAAEAFAKFNEQYKQSELAVDALLGWAYALENNQQYSDSQKIYLDVVRTEKASAEAKAEAYCGAGRTALALDTPEKARQHFESAMAEVDQGVYRQQAEQMLEKIQEKSANHE
ncbi:MAG: hypothetical protein R6V56_02385 [Lentisphaeria bacterium]